MTTSTDLYSNGGPVPTTPADLAEEVELSPRLAAAIAYADEVLGVAARLRYGPWAVTKWQPTA